jgi:dihydroflavonol-4-reductase
MKALVTGATGFLGSHLCRRLVADGFDLTILSRPTSNTKALANLPFTKKTGDVTDAQAVMEAIQGNEVVFHAAAHGAYWRRQKYLQNEINIQGTRNVVDACQRANVKKLVYISSMSAIGIPQNPKHPANENFRFNLESSRLNYHISKKRAEEAVFEAFEKGLDATIVNPCSIWGQFGNQYRLQEFVEKVQQTRIVPYFTGGTCIVHVEDVVDGIMKALTQGKSGERYILGGENLTFKEIAEIAAREMQLRRTFIPVLNAVSWFAAAALESASLISGRRPRITFVTHYCASRFHYYDSSKARRELGFSPRDFKAILSECIEFIEAKKIKQSSSSNNN